MAWWRWGNSTPAADDRTGRDRQDIAAIGLTVPRQRRPMTSVGPLALPRLEQALRRNGVRYLTDADGGLLALWERHAVLFTVEGPAQEILVMRARAHATVPPEWADRAYAAVNEWNHTRRFFKGYVGNATERGGLPVYAEMQVPLLAGVHDALLDEFVECAGTVAAAYVDWMHDEGAVL